MWAPNARRVSVVGDFNYWDGRRHPMRFRPEYGIWEIFIPHASENQCYKFELIDIQGKLSLKADPYAFESEMRPKTASVIRGLPQSIEMTTERRNRNAFDAPISIYEVHLASWRRHKEDGLWLSYNELAQQLIPLCKSDGFYPY